MSTVRNLGASVEFCHGHAIVPIISLEKHSRGMFSINYSNESCSNAFLVSKPAAVRGFLQIKEFPEDKCLCPVTTLQYYLEKASLSMRY